MVRVVAGRVQDRDADEAGRVDCAYMLAGLFAWAGKRGRNKEGEGRETDHSDATART